MKKHILLTFVVAFAAMALATTGVAQTKGPSKAAVAKSTKISAEQAKKIALAKYKGKVTKAPVLEQEDGKTQWEVIVMTGKTMVEVNVDANSGKITSTEKVTAKEEAKEKAEKKKGKG